MLIVSFQIGKNKVYIAKNVHLMAPQSKRTAAKTFETECAALKAIEIYKHWYKTVEFSIETL